MGRLLTQADGDFLQNQIHALEEARERGHRERTRLSGANALNEQTITQLTLDQESTDEAVVLVDARLVVVEEAIKVVSRTIVIEDPEDGDDITFFFTDRDLTLVEARVSQTGGTSIEWALWSGQTPHAQTTQHFGHTQLVGTGTVYPLADAHVQTYHHLTFIQGTTVGTPTEIMVTLFYMED